MEDPILKHTVIAILIVAGSVIVGQLLKSLLDIFFRKLVQKTGTTLDDRILPVIGSHVMPLMLVGGISIGIREVRKGLTLEHTTHHQILDYLAIIVFIVFVLLITRLVSRLAKSALEWYMEELAVKTQHAGAGLVAPLLMKFINVLLFFIVTLIILDHVGINVGSLLVSLGVGSLAVALAAQETLSNMIGWFVILLDQPFRVGDQIKLMSGEEGKVFQIGLRATRIINPDNNLVIIPNGDLVKSRIVNLSLPDTMTRLFLEVNISYDTDVERVRRTILRLLEHFPDVVSEPAPEVLAVNFGDAGMLVRLTGRVPFARKFAVETGLREQILRAFKKDGIKLGVPQRMIQQVQSHETKAS